MGRPREVSEEERAELIRKGYRPIEVWVPDFTSEVYRLRAALQAKASAEADRKAGIIEFTDESPADDWEKP